MARKEYTEVEKEEIRGRGKDFIFNIDETHPSSGIIVEAFDLTESDRESFIFADIPKGEGSMAYEIIELGDPYNDAYGDLRRDILLRSVLNTDHLTNWIVSPETKTTLFPNSRIVRL